jgi:hypothetical protein
MARSARIDRRAGEISIERVSKVYGFRFPHFGIHMTHDRHPWATIENREKGGKCIEVEVLGGC